MDKMTPAELANAPVGTRVRVRRSGIVYSLTAQQSAFGGFRHGLQVLANGKLSYTSRELKAESLEFVST